MKTPLTFLMSEDYTQIDIVAVNTSYRQNVRQMIPADVQDAIRGQCGDRALPGQPFWLYLPAICILSIKPERAGKAAALLRASPRLINDFHWQLAARSGTSFVNLHGLVDQILGC